jgi:hypothetical protein
MRSRPARCVGTRSVPDRRAALRPAAPTAVVRPARSAGSAPRTPHQPQAKRRDGSQEQPGRAARSAPRSGVS